MNYNDMQKILERVAWIAKQMQQDSSRKNREHGYDVQADARNLARHFARYLGQNGHHYDAVRAEFEKIVE